MNICLTAPGQTGGTTITEPSIRDRLQTAATELFAEQGFAGTSVREICARADASVPMISHYFGSKKGLFDRIVGQLSGDVFDVPVRLLGGELKSRDEFLTKLELFISETFNALVSLAPVFRIITREGGAFADMTKVKDALAGFLTQAQARGFLRASLRPELTTSLVLDRLGNQVLFAVKFSDTAPSVLTDSDLRAEWLAANTDVLLFGLAGE